MTLIGVALEAGMTITPVYLALKKTDKQKIEVIDDSFLFKGLIKDAKIFISTFRKFHFRLQRQGWKIPIMMEFYGFRKMY